LSTLYGTVGLHTTFTDWATASGFSGESSGTASATAPPSRLLPPHEDESPPPSLRRLAVSSLTTAPTRTNPIDS
jgi:hypothetical protein